MTESGSDFWPPRRMMKAEAAESRVRVHPIVLAVKALTALVLLAIVSLLFGFFIVLVDVAALTAAPWASPARVIVPSAIVLALFMLQPAVMALLEAALFLRTYRFSLRKEFLFAREGVIHPAYTLIPYENIQDVQLNEGPVERLSGTASVIISTPASGLTVPFVPLAEARTLKDDILSNAGRHRRMAE